MSTIDLPPVELSRAKTLSDEALIQLILQYHDAHVRDLTAAMELAAIVVGQPAGSANSPAALSAAIRRMLDTLRLHQAREEAVLFPLVLGGRRGALRYPIAALGADHDEVQDRLERLVRLTCDFTPPSDACATWRRLYDLCRKFDRDFREHVLLEERVLFPRFG